MAVLCNVLMLTAVMLGVVNSQVVVKNVYSEVKFYGCKTFLSFVNKTGLTTMFKDPRENLTVFAPSEEAFKLLPSDILDRMETDKAFLEQLVGFHIVSGLQTITTDNAVFQTLFGSIGRINVYTDPNITTISGSEVLLPDNYATNGVVEILERVMYSVPTGTALGYISENSFSLFFLALTKAGISSFLNAEGITLFAPADVAFQRLPAGVFSQLLNNLPLLRTILQNHLVSRVVYSAFIFARGGVVLESQSGQQLNVTVADKTTLRVETATVTSIDINVDNGVIHVIDTVLLLPNLYQQMNRPSFRLVS